jgi:formylglycine-generating enzyme required for sulfatase activity
MLGEDLTRSSNFKVGDKAILVGEDFSVVGIYETHLGLENNMILMLLEDAQRLIGKPGQITGCTVVVRDPSPEAVEKLKTCIEGEVAKKLKLEGKVQAAPPAGYAEAQALRGIRPPPAENVSWDDAREFCRRLSDLPREKAAGRTYRLPTEAEWEYAASGVATADLDATAWYKKNSTGLAYFVGQKWPNAWGLFDMQGNVAEWCADWYAADSYSSAVRDDPAGPATAAERVVRGGGWDSPAANCRVTARRHYPPGRRGPGVGLRVITVPGR